MSIQATWTTHKYKPVVHREKCPKLFLGAGSWVFDQCCQLHGRHLWKPGLGHLFPASSLMWLTCMKEGGHCLTSIWLSGQGPKSYLYAVGTAVYTRVGSLLWCSGLERFEGQERTTGERDELEQASKVSLFSWQLTPSIPNVNNNLRSFQLFLGCRCNIGISWRGPGIGEI